MKTSERTVHQPKMMLKQTNRFCNGKRLDYALYGTTNSTVGHFRVTVKGFGEQAEAEFEEELSSALLLFDKLVEGTVPPCVLQEIVDDQLQMKA